MEIFEEDSRDELEAKVVPVKMAEWDCRYSEEYDDYVPCCSNCGEPDALSRVDYAYRGGKIRDNDSNYCPNCGAKMTLN